MCGVRVALRNSLAWVAQGRADCSASAKDSAKSRAGQHPNAKQRAPFVTVPIGCQLPMRIVGPPPSTLLTQREYRMHATSSKRADNTLQHQKFGTHRCVDGHPETLVGSIYQCRHMLHQRCTNQSSKPGSQSQGNAAQIHIEGAEKMQQDARNESHNN